MPSVRVIIDYDSATFETELNCGLSKDSVHEILDSATQCTKNAFDTAFAVYGVDTVGQLTGNNTK